MKFGLKIVRLVSLLWVVMTLTWPLAAAWGQSSPEPAGVSESAAPDQSQSSPEGFSQLAAAEPVAVSSQAETEPDLVFSSGTNPPQTSSQLPSGQAASSAAESSGQPPELLNVADQIDQSASSDSSSGGLVLTESAAKSLASSKVADRDEAITSLNADPSDAATAVLKSLLEGRLMVDRQALKFYSLTPEGLIDFSTMTLSEVDPSSLKKVGINNRQREGLVASINNRTLLNPNPVIRRQASAGLIGSADVDSQVIESLLTSETDQRVRLNYQKILALNALRDPGSPAEKVLAALELFRQHLTREAAEYIGARAASDDPAVASAALETLRVMDNKFQHIALFETVFFGLSLGSVLVLIGIGLAITFGVMGVINMAHGEMVMLGAYCVWGLQTLMPGRPGAALILAIPVSFVATGLIGGLIERTVIRYLYDRPLETLLATYGLSLIIQQAVKILISSNNRSVETPAFMSGMLFLTDQLSVTFSRLYIVGFCFFVFVLILLITQKTRLGLEIRAVTQNRDVAQAMGVNSSRVDTMTFILGSGVAGMAGVALSQLTNVGPNLGQSYIVDSFMVVVFGGVGNLWGTFLGGLLIGMANKFLEPLNGAIMAKILIMVGIILFIQRHPSGLFPQKDRGASLK
ncbi:MAG: urea ABC transporter permease subunit UrtB [Deltaproteobacteria bacterium]|nr:urea ABC transporter permease subunit UrtB [Deltaproteobacteria bacterium]